MGVGVGAAGGGGVGPAEEGGEGEAEEGAGGLRGVEEEERQAEG